MGACCTSSSTPRWLREDPAASAKNWPGSSSEQLLALQAKLAKLGRGPSGHGPDEKLIEVFGRKVEGWEAAKDVSLHVSFTRSLEEALPRNPAIEGHRSELLHQLLQLSPAVEDDVRVFARATALGAAKIRNKLCSEQGGSWRWDSDMPFEMVVGDAVVNPDDGLVLVRSGWLAKGVVYRERGHDEQGFDIIRIQLKTQKSLKETYVFSINLGSDMFKDAS